MRRRGVPEPVVVVCPRNIHKVRLRQGDSVSAMLFRWIIEDMYSEMKPKREKLGYRVVLQGNRLTLLAWADDAWNMAKDVDELELMIEDLRNMAQRRTGPQLRVPKCTWTDIQLRDQGDSSIRQAQHHSNLLGMRKLPAGECLGVLGTYIQCDGERTWSTGMRSEPHGGPTLEEGPLVHETAPSTKDAGASSQCVHGARLVRWNSRMHDN